MPLAIVSIGLPGSGKTTLLSAIAEQYGLIRINKDEIRGELFGDIHDQSHNQEVWEESNRRIRAMLEAGQGVILDNTNLERWKRAEVIELLRAAGASPIIGVVFEVPAEVARERNRSRATSVKEDVMEWMEKKLLEEPPELSEGFDVLYTHGELGKALGDAGTDLFD
ncbi:MAG: shikimate kinase [Parcubacteria group bacterium]|nr:shikimate kinase [Parcubacteria group bacterium]